MKQDINNLNAKVAGLVQEINSLKSQVAAFKRLAGAAPVNIRWVAGVPMVGLLSRSIGGVYVCELNEDIDGEATGDAKLLLGDFTDSGDTIEVTNPGQDDGDHDLSSGDRVLVVDGDGHFQNLKVIVAVMC